MSTPVEVAESHWTDGVPDWVMALARACAESNQRQVAARLDRSPALISQVLRNKYPGDMDAIEEAVRGAYMDASVQCPALGPIPADECQGWRRKSRRFVNVNALRVSMFRACARCPVNRRKDK